MDLEPSANVSPPPRDRRPHMPEPPPVRLVAIEDVRLFTPAGLETKLDEFYVDLLGLEREEREQVLSYRAENVRVIIGVREPPIDRPDLRALGVEVPSLAETEAKFIARELDYQRLRGLLAGQETLLLQDPAGNWLSISESRGIR